MAAVTELHYCQCENYKTERNDSNYAFIWTLEQGYFTVDMTNVKFPPGGDWEGYSTLKVREEHVGVYHVGDKI